MRTLPAGTLTRRANAAWFSSWLLYAQGNKPDALKLLEDSLRVLRGTREKPPPPLSMPYVFAAECLAAGDARAADSLALLGRAATAVDSLALQRSGYAGRAELVHARAGWLWAIVPPHRQPPSAP
jgi:hypothetical protein